MTSNLDVYTGASANWDSKAINIIEHLLTLKGERYTYVSVAEAVGMPTAEVSRYLREECFERRDYKWLLGMRKYKKVAYNHYLNNHKLVNRGISPEGKPINELYINFSKHRIFLMNCRLRNVRVAYEILPDSGKRLVHLFENMDDMRTKLYYEIPQISCESLEPEYLGEEVYDEFTGDSLESSHSER